MPRKRSADEGDVALQRGMLPRDLPTAPGLHPAVRYTPGDLGLNVGGD